MSAYENRFKSVADARLYLAIHGVDLENTVKILLTMEKNDFLSTPIVNAIFSPVGCGDTANAFCKLMTGDEMIPFKNKETQSLTLLSEELENNLPKLIRINIPGHSYVMLACEKSEEGILGYVYQSNVAYGIEDNLFSLSEWLMDIRSHKTNLSQHLLKLHQLINPRVSIPEKIQIYRELYIAQPIAKVTVPADMQTIISYINENIFIRYDIREVNAKNMLSVLERLKRITNQIPEEQMQELGDYIRTVKDELPQFSVEPY